MQAYPHVITTTANMSGAAQYWLMRLYNNTTSMQKLRECVNNSLKHRGAVGRPITDGMNGLEFSELTHMEHQQIKQMPQFYAMGVSLGIAFAHPDSGDTVGTVMYGGLRTVLNGPVAANTGQPVQWIFEFEAGLFDKKGRRMFPTLPEVVEVR